MTMKKNILSMVTLLIASATVFTLLPIKELLIYFTLHNDVIRTFLRFLNFHILHLFEILHGTNIHLFEIFRKSFDGKSIRYLIILSHFGSIAMQNIAVRGIRNGW